MAIKVKRKSRAKNRDRGAGRLKLVTTRMPGIDVTEPCDCPICKAFGIDISQLEEGASQVTDIDSVEDEMLLSQLMDQANGVGERN